MSQPVTIRRAAKADLAEARNWYERQRPGLGQEFLSAIAAALTRLEADPEHFPIYYTEYRRVLVDRFPYKVFFQIRKDAVIVFRVLHAARDHRRGLPGG